MLALALSGGIAFGDSAAASSDSALWLGATIVVVAALVPPRPALLSPAALGVAFAAGCLAQRSELELADHHAIAHAIDATVEARVCDLELQTAWVSVVLCEVRSPTGLPLPRRVRVREMRVHESQEPESGSSDTQWLQSLSLGERVRARLRLRPLREAGNPGQRSRTRAERRRGIGANAALVSPLLGVSIASEQGAPDASFADRVARQRARIAARLAAAGPGGALLRALAVGDRSGLTRSQRDEWVRLGISHLLAVSGLHLALAAGLAYALLRASLTRVTALAMRCDVRTGALLGACLAAACFALLAGWGIPVRRALVFLCAAAAARLLGRHFGPAHVLAAAAIAVLTADPAALFEPGAQLSFLASAALLYSISAGAGAPEGRRSRVGQLVGGAVAILRTTATITALTAPLLALHEMPVSSVSLLANLVAIPATTLLLLPMSLGSAIAASAPPGVVADASIALAEWAGDLALRVASAAASFVGSSALRPAPPLAWMATAFALGLSSLRCVRTLPRVMIAAAVVSLLRVAPVPMLPPEPPRVVSFDVGSGDATLVQGRSGALLVDGGVALPGGLDLGRSVVLPALRALGVARIDLVVASHADADHRGGLPSVLDALPVGELWLPPGGIADPSLAELLAAARRGSTRVLERGRGDATVQLGDLRVTPLWPPRADRMMSRNDASLVLRVEASGRRVLLTGDIGAGIEARLLAAGEDLRADLLKVAHHGSRFSSSPAFLAAVGADLALVSAPCSVRAALPTGASLARLRAAGAAPWWTGRHGAVFVALSPPAGALAAWSWLRTPRESCSWLRATAR